MPRMQPIMNRLGGRCRRSYDIKLFWDLLDPQTQRCVLSDISILQPKAIMLSPPCAYVCALMHSNWPRMDVKKRIINLNEALQNIDFSSWVAEYQHDVGRYFALEHPGPSLAWDRKSAPWLDYNQLVALFLLIMFYVFPGVIFFFSVEYHYLILVVCEGLG